MPEQDQHSSCCSPGPVPIIPWEMTAFVDFLPVASPASSSAISTMGARWARPEQQLHHKHGQHQQLLQQQQQKQQQQDSLDDIAALLSPLTAANTLYQRAHTPDQKKHYRDMIRSAAQRIVAQTTSPEDALMEFLFQPHQNATVRLAIALGLFHAIPATAAISLTKLAYDLNSQPDFVHRVVRILVAMGTLLEPTANTYAHTSQSLLWRNKAIEAYTIHQWEDINFAMLKFEPYFRQYGFQSPEDPKNAPFTYASGCHEETFFDILAKDPARHDNFSRAMGFIPAGVTDLFPFQALRYESERVGVVDVGGGKGDALLEIQRAVPSLRGRCVLQDLPRVLQSGNVLPDGDVELQAYDFFSEVQPVNGAAIYLYKWIFHDWPDSKCQTILHHLAPAMTPGYSRLLISDLVISDERPELGKVLFDMNMITIAGKERSLKEWEELLGSAGFEIVNVYSRGTNGNSIIEAVLAGHRCDTPKSRL